MNKLIIFIKDLFLSSDFVKNVTTVASGTLIAQVISIITLPILSRLFNPGDFGVLGLFTSTVSIMSVVAAGRYEFAIMLPKNDNKALNIVLLSVTITVIICILSFLIIGFFNQNITIFLNDNSTIPWLWLVPFGIFALTFFNIMNYWNNRKKKFKQLAFSRVFQSLVNSGTGLLFGIMRFSAIGLVLGSILGNAFSSFFLFIQNKKDRFHFEINKAELINTSKEYLDFPKKSIPGAFLNILSGQLPILIIGSLYNAEIVGFYALTMRILSIPMSLIGYSVSQVYYQKAVEAHNDGNLKQLVKNTTKRMLLIIIIPMTVIFFTGDQLFSFIFGGKWSVAGGIAQIMAPFFIVRFIFSSQSTLMMVLRRMDFEIKFNFLFLTSQLLSLYSGYYFFDSYIWSFIFMSLSGFLIFLILGIWLYKNSKVKS